MSLNRRCTLASIRCTMILPASPPTAGCRFRPLLRGALNDAGVGCECVCADRLLPSRLSSYSIMEVTSQPLVKHLRWVVPTHSIVGIASTCGPTNSGAHISKLIGAQPGFHLAYQSLHAEPPCVSPSGETPRKELFIKLIKVSFVKAQKRHSQKCDSTRLTL